MRRLRLDGVVYSTTKCNQCACCSSETRTSSARIQHQWSRKGIAMPYDCPRCGAPMEYEDDMDQETWAHVEGSYHCPNGHIFSESEIEYEGDFDDDDYEDEE